MDTNNEKKKRVHETMTAGTSARGTKDKNEWGKYLAMKVVFGIFIVGYLMFYLLDNMWGKVLERGQVT